MFIAGGSLILAVYIVDQERALDLFWVGLAAIAMGISGFIVDICARPIIAFTDTALNIGIRIDLVGRWCTVWPRRKGRHSLALVAPSAWR